MGMSGTAIVMWLGCIAGSGMRINMGFQCVFMGIGMHGRMGIGRQHQVGQRYQYGQGYQYISTHNFNDNIVPKKRVENG